MGRATWLLALLVSVLVVAARSAVWLDLSDRPAEKRAAFPLPTRTTLREGMAGAEVIKAFGPPERRLKLQDGSRLVEAWGYGVLLVMLAEGKVTRVAPYSTGREWARTRPSFALRP